MPKDVQLGLICSGNNPEADLEPVKDLGFAACQLTVESYSPGLAARVAAALKRPLSAADAQRWRNRAVAAPIPDDAPVTTAILSFQFLVVILFLITKGHKEFPS